jgi:hypothetical protein
MSVKLIADVWQQYPRMESFTLPLSEAFDRWLIFKKAGKGNNNSNAE